MDGHATLHVLCAMTDPPKPVGIDVKKGGTYIASVSLEDLRKCVAELDRLEEARKPKKS